MAVISNTTTIIDAGAISVATGAMTLIKTLTASSSANLSFVNGASSVVLDGTYKQYVFKFYNIHPQTDDKNFTVNFRDGATNYDATKTSTYFHETHAEGNGSESAAYVTGHDLAQGTGAQILSEGISNDADHGSSGELTLFDPANTTFVKHFICRSNGTRHSNISSDVFVDGYCNVTAAIDAVQFAMSSGNIDSGTIKMYGIK